MNSLNFSLFSKAAIGSLALLGAAMSTASGQSVAEFYRGKTVSVLVGAGAGGAFDITARLVGKYMQKYMPGNPTFVVQNIEGAGGLRMANQLANASPRDGLTIAAHNRGVLIEPIIGGAEARFDPVKLTWIGTVSSNQKDAYLMLIRGDTGMKSADDLRKSTKTISIGATTGTNTNVIFGSLSQPLFGFNVRLVKGYMGSPALNLAAQQGEVQGLHTGLSEIRRLQADQLTSGAIIPVVQFARTTRHPDIPNVPMGSELLSTPEDLSLLKFVESVFFVSFPLSGPPEMPQDRLAAMRQALEKTWRDSEFLTEAARASIDVSPINGQEVTRLMGELAATPQSIVKRYKDLVGIQ
jgi:tripartite-type tricarboxylate transporter receptor subunit TctC